MPAGLCGLLSFVRRARDAESGLLLGDTAICIQHSMQTCNTHLDKNIILDTDLKKAKQFLICANTL